MENYIENIELIDNYINKVLSEAEVKAFKNRLKTDASFKETYEIHLIFLEGLKRQTLKADIKKAKQSYIKGKWFRYFGFTTVILIGFAFIYFNVFKNTDESYLKNKLNFEAELIQNFKVAADSIITIIGKKGTVIKFNSNDLQTIGNKPFKSDSLNIELIELTTKNDLLLANAQTRSNGKWLVSGGAFKIDIKYEGESLILREGKTINVKFPKNTNETGMQIFYEEREGDNNMNWQSSNTELKDKEYYVISLKDSSVIDVKLSKQFGVDMIKDIVLADTLGYLNYKKIVKCFSEVEKIKIDSDTLRIGCMPFYKYKYVQVDSLIDDGVGTHEKEYILFTQEEQKNILMKNNFVLGEIDYPEMEYRTILFSKEEFEKLINYNDYEAIEIYKKEVAEKKLYNEIENDFYESVQLSKLGWINIDKFAIKEETVAVNFNYSSTTNYNQTYIIDEKNNTVLNVYNSIDLPINRSFYIISIGVKEKDLYGFKKLVKFNKPGDVKIDYRKIKEKQIKSFLTTIFF